MKPFHLLVAVPVVMIFFVMIFLAVTEGQENKNCRASKGVPVRTERGYECLK